MSFYVTVTNLADHAHDVPIQPERARQHLIEEHGCGDIRRMKISPDEALERDLEYHDYLHKADDAALPDSMMNEPVHDPDEEERIDRILVRLECGIEFSIVWGSGTYSSNRYFGMEDILKKPKQDFIEESPTAEVAVWDNKDRWLGPYGWVTPEQVLAAIDALMVPGVLDIGTARAALERGEING